MTGLFGGGGGGNSAPPAPPPIAPPAPMPIPDDEAAKLRTMRRAASLASTGRASTIMSDYQGPESAKVGG